MDGILKEIGLRRAKRALDPASLSEETVERILTAAVCAPSCYNHQPWRFLVATEKQALEKLHQALSEGNYWAKRAPVMVAVATKNNLDCQLNDRRDYALFDCGLAVENMILQAVHEGLYAHPMAGFEPLKVKEFFGIPSEYTVITLVAIGRPGDDAHLSEKHRHLENSPRDRKPVPETVCYNAWNFGESDRT